MIQIFSPINRIAATILVLLIPAILVGCAVVEKNPEIQFTSISSDNPKAKKSAIAGFHGKVSEGSYITYNLGTKIVSIDGKAPSAWHGAIIEAGERKIVVQFHTLGSQTGHVTLALTARPGHRYLILGTDSNPVEKQLTQRIVFWIEDVDTQEVVSGNRPLNMSFASNPRFQAVYSLFREALGKTGIGQ